MDSYAMIYKLVGPALVFIPPPDFPDQRGVEGSIHTAESKDFYDQAEGTHRQYGTHSIFICIHYSELDQLHYFASACVFVVERSQVDVTVFTIFSNAPGDGNQGEQVS